MRKRTKIVAAVAAAAIAVSMLCFSFASWNTGIEMNGAVSANGKWDVAVTDASITLSNNGAAFGTTTGSATETVSKTYSSVDDDQYVYIKNASTSTQKELKALAGDLTYDEKVEQVSAELIAAGAENLVVQKFNQVFFVEYTLPDIDGTLIWITSDSSDRESRFYELYPDATSYTEGNYMGCSWFTITYTIEETTEGTIESETTWTDTTVNYADVVFSLPGAWAQYFVTVTNNGTVNANLSDYVFDFDALDDEIFLTDIPDLSNEVLEPGESCTFTFIIQVDPAIQKDIDVAATNFKIALSYTQDTVEPAPEASHSHS